jgi:hypothetical protein
MSMTRADVTVFPKRCVHGVPMTAHRRFSGSAYYQPGECEACREAERQREAQDDAEMSALCERIKARKEPT